MSLLSILTGTINLFFPSQCVGCGIIGDFLCVQCMTIIPQSNNLSQSWITALFDYQNPVIRNAIWRLKYKNARGIAKYFGQRIYKNTIVTIKKDHHHDKKFLIIPIPLHIKRFRERGYNQSELLARALLIHDSDERMILSINILFRIRETTPQAKGRKRAARIENLQGAFFADPAHVHGEHIILIDDVATTGATLSEARKILLAAGACCVQAVVVAH